jgi:hypothetical protein
MHQIYVLSFKEREQKSNQNVDNLANYNRANKKEEKTILFNYLYFSN